MKLPGQVADRPDPQAWCRQMIAFGWILWGILVVLVLLPPRYDPAIRMREWVDRK